jgi:hypothetical protein
MKRLHQYLFFLLLLIFGASMVPEMLVAQTNWEVVKIRGKVRTKGTKIRIGSRISDQQKIGFSTTSDLLVVRKIGADGTEYRFVKPESFTSQEAAGVICASKCGAKWETPLISMSSFFLHLQPNVCDSILLQQFEMRGIGYKFCPKYRFDSLMVMFKMDYDLMDWLPPGQRMELYSDLASPNCRYYLAITPEKTIALVDMDTGLEMWSPGISAGIDSTVMSGNGTWEMYGNNGRQLWQSQTKSDNSSCSYLQIFEDGNLKIVSPIGYTIWETRTWNGSANTATIGYANPGMAFNYNPNYQYKFAALTDKTALEINTLANDKSTFSLGREVAGKAAQEWILVPDGNTPFFRIQSQSLQHLMANVQVNRHYLKTALPDPDDELSDRWDIISTGETGVFFIRNAKGNYLEADVVKHTVSLRPYTGKPAQQWKMIAVVK